MPAHPVDIHVGKRLRYRRSILGISQHALGKEIGITFQQIQKYERGTNRIGSSRLYDFSRILSVPVSYFFEEMNEVLDASNNLVEGFAETPNFEYELENKETITLIKAYYQIKDPKIRKKIIGLIKAISPNE